MANNLIKFIKIEINLLSEFIEDTPMLTDQVQTNEITVTASAADAVRDLLDKRNLDDYALRIFISGGGCAGFQYGMALDNNIRETDLSFEMNGVNVIVDEVSINYLRGATVDYVDELMGSGFKIDNPNAVAACGCGSSFRTKDEQGSPNQGGGCSC
jgi:iron-sulfur cluster assembly accessory protein